MIAKRLIDTRFKFCVLWSFLNLEGTIGKENLQKIAMIFDFGNKFSNFRKLYFSFVIFLNSKIQNKYGIKWIQI